MGNGTLTSSELAGVYAGHRLRADAAQSWLRLCNYFGRPIKLTDSYRPLALQEKIFFERYAPLKTGGGFYGDVKYYRGVRYVRRKGVATAAVPGTSNHGTGLAVDVGDGVNKGSGEVWDWLNRFAGMFGWFNPAWAKTKNYYEPWHWEYNPAKDTKKNEPLEGAVTSVKEWDEMASLEELRQVFMEVLGGTDIAGAVWNRDLGGQGKVEDTTWYMLAETRNNTRALGKLVTEVKTELAKAGVAEDVIENAIGKALAGLEITLGVK